MVLAQDWVNSWGTKKQKEKGLSSKENIEGRPEEGS